MSKTTIRTMATLELFSSCRRAELARIDQLGTTLDVPAGRTLCDEGAPGAEFFVLIDGNAVVRTGSEIVAVLHPGAWFGEAALLDGAPRRATVTTTTHATVIVFARREFHHMLAVAPSVRARIRRTATRVIDGSAPTRQPWYQPLPGDVPLLSFGSR